MQVPQGRQDGEHVGDRLRGGQRRRSLLAIALLGPQLLQALAADVLHDDVARVLVLDEVEDLDDVRVLDLGQEASLDERGGGRVVVAGVEQALEHHPAVGHVVVARQVDPSHPAVREAAHDLVLAGDDVARGELGSEGERRAALAAESFRASRGAVAPAPDGLSAAGAEAPGLDDLRILHDRRRRVAVGHGGHVDEARPEAAANHPRRAARDRPACLRRGRAAEDRLRGRGWRGLRSRGHPAHVAVAVDDRARTAIAPAGHRATSLVVGRVESACW